MTKGKPWPVDDERKLREKVNAGADLDGLVASFGDRYSRNSVYQKMVDLGLKATKTMIHHDVPSSTGPKLILPKELPSIEESLKTLVAASNAMEAAGLTRTDIIRLRSIILAQISYQEQFPKYVKYRDLEAEVMELRKELTAKKNARET